MLIGHVKHLCWYAGCAFLISRLFCSLEKKPFKCHDSKPENQLKPLPAWTENGKNIIWEKFQGFINNFPYNDQMKICHRHTDIKLGLPVSSTDIISKLKRID